MDPCKTFNLIHSGSVKRVNGTSTRFFFVVSIEVLHGDLGMLNWTEMANHQKDFSSPEGFCDQTQSLDYPRWHSSMNPF